MPESDLTLLTEAAREAGEIALRYWKRNPRVWEKPGNEGPVTEADLAVNEALGRLLRPARPGYGWLSEEDADTPDRQECEHLFLIDPIDGTRAFIEGDRSFSHSLAIARGGQVTTAVVYLPALDRLYTATVQGPALCNGLPIRASLRAAPEGASLLTPKANLSPDLWLGPVPPVTRAFRASVAYRLCLVAEGAFDGMLSLRQAWEWDIAAGALIAARAGATVSNRRGEAVTFNAEVPRSNGLLAAAPGLHAHLIARLKP